MLDDNLYKSHCIHGNPIYYEHFCTGCRCLKQERQKKRYHNYWKDRRGDFETFFNEEYNYYFQEKKVNTDIIDNDKFTELKLCKSKKELKKTYYCLCRIHHPDKGGCHKVMAKLNQLYDYLLLRF